MTPRLLLLLALLALAAATPVRAEEPLWGETASTLGKGFLNATTFGDFRSYKPYRHHGGPVTLAIDRTELAAGIEYGLRPDLDLRVRIPYFTENIQEQFGGDHLDNPLSGMGEMKVGAKWRFLQSISRIKDEMALTIDLKLPTGSHELRDSGGALITPHLQPNSGNLGASLGLAANRHTPQGGYWLSGVATAETASSRLHRAPMLELHGSAGWRLRPLRRPDQVDWIAVSGLHFEWMGKEEELGRTLRDSGGTVLGVEISFLGTRSNLGARLGLMLPLLTDLGKSEPPPRFALQGSLRASF
jgi:hypothetical protein